MTYNISPHNLERFRQLYKKHYGRELSENESEKLFNALIALFLTETPKPEQKNERETSTGDMKPFDARRAANGSSLRDDTVSCLSP